MPTFTTAAVERIRRSVRVTESLSHDLTAPRRRAEQVEPSLWAKLTGMDLNGHVYSWIRVDPDGKGEFVPDYRARGGNAYEANGRVGIRPGTIVRLFLMGRGADGEPAYVFMSPAGGDDDLGIRVHDHRDNHHGGFAFAVLHPGTALPQMPWSL
jgi:hypothetical protein